MIDAATRRFDGRFRMPGGRWVIAGLLVVAGVGLAAGCGRRARPAVGDPQQIVVFADDVTWERYGETLSGIFEQKVRIPREEYVFTLRREGLDSWEFFRQYKHVILCASLEEQTPTAEKISALLSPQARERVIQQERGLHIARKDMFRDGQLVLILTADTRAHLETYLEENRQMLFDLFSEHYSEHLLNLIFRREEQIALEDTLFDSWEFLVRVPYDYRLDASRAGASFIRMIKYLPQRYFFAYWIPVEELPDRGLDWALGLEALGRMMEEGEEPDPDQIRALGQRAMNLRDEITREFYDRDEVDRERTAATLVPFNGRWAIRLYGVWVNRERIVGGPLVAYCFLDPQTGRLWWLDGAIFAPEMRKKEIYLRQMDVILNTFRSGPDAQAYLTSVLGADHGHD